MVDLITLSTDRFLRDRPVKLPTKAQEIITISNVRGRGNRGRGNRGGHGGPS